MLLSVSPRRRLMSAASRTVDLPLYTNAIGGDGSDIGAVEIGAIQLVAPLRLTHGSAGAFDIDLPLTGTPGVECRNGNGNFTLVLTFTNEIASALAQVSSGNGTVVGLPISNGNEMTINLTGVTDAQQLTVTVSNIFDTYGQTLASIPVTMDVLLGDTTGNAQVNSSDVSQAKICSGRALDDTNFRCDVNLSGSLNSSDVSVVKANCGHGIPMSIHSMQTDSKAAGAK